MKKFNYKKPTAINLWKELHLNTLKSFSWSSHDDRIETLNTGLFFHMFTEAIVKVWGKNKQKYEKKKCGDIF